MGDKAGRGSRGGEQRHGQFCPGWPELGEQVSIHFFVAKVHFQEGELYAPSGLTAL